AATFFTARVTLPGGPGLLSLRAVRPMHKPGRGRHLPRSAQDRLRRRPSRARLMRNVVHIPFVVNNRYTFSDHDSVNSAAPPRSVVSRRASAGARRLACPRLEPPPKIP